ncbi:FAD-linked oxidase C-terminal domain-containing protein, partial [Rhizobiaceae sp. 2RAB30]
SVTYRLESLTDLLGNAGPIESVEAERSRLMWRDVRDCIPFADASERPVWRMSVAPSEAAKLVLALRMEAGADAFYDWQGGLVWLRMEGDPEAELLRRLIRQFGGGHATLVRAAPSWRASVPVFEPQTPALAALSARLKEQFDPKGILNPGRIIGNTAGDGTN